MTGAGAPSSTSEDDDVHELTPQEARRIAKRLEATGQIVTVRGPTEYAATIAELRTRLAAIAKVLGIKPAQ